mmetsp:Transcript_6947/g.21259  ORF Transcript_6947/g.21259 Transcript_6947/m.21259 type:complete len:118 (-) Transcript_6947:275-628(-)
MEQSMGCSTGGRGADRAIGLDDRAIEWDLSSILDLSSTKGGCTQASKFTSFCKILTVHCPTCTVFKLQSTKCGVQICVIRGHTHLLLATPLLLVLLAETAHVCKVVIMAVRSVLFAL